jgi:microcin C transport system substrate-binding protein
VLPFQHNLQRLGIVMDIRQVDNSQYSNRKRSRDYDMMPNVWRATPWPGTDLQISWTPNIFTPATTPRGTKPGRR